MNITNNQFNIGVLAIALGLPIAAGRIGTAIQDNIEAQENARFSEYPDGCRYDVWLLKQFVQNPGKYEVLKYENNRPRGTAVLQVSPPMTTTVDGEGSLSYQEVRMTGADNEGDRVIVTTNDAGIIVMYPTLKDALAEGALRDPKLSCPLSDEDRKWLSGYVVFK